MVITVQSNDLSEDMRIPTIGFSPRRAMTISYVESAQPLIMVVG
jgi:hypothetical protein